MNNYWHTNYRAGQGGNFTFRYVLTSADHLDPAALSRLGWESMEAPAFDSVINQDKAGNPDEPLPAEGTSFLDINAANVVLVTGNSPRMVRERFCVFRRQQVNPLKALSGFPEPRSIPPVFVTRLKIICTIWTSRVTKST